MLKSMVEANVVTRIEQITILFDQICIEHPIRIEINKINQPTQLIIFAWILAICRKGYDFFGEIDFKDHALNGMAEGMRRKLIDVLQGSGELVGLNAKYFDEPDIATGQSYKKKLSYKLPPKIMTKLICDDPAFNKILAIKENNPISSRQVIPKYREDAISKAVIHCILPKLFPNKTLNLSANEKNRLKFKCFEMLKSTLEKDGCTISFWYVDISLLLDLKEAPCPSLITIQRLFFGILKGWIM